MKILSIMLEEGRFEDLKRLTEDKEFRKKLLKENPISQ